MKWSWGTDLVFCSVPVCIRPKHHCVSLHWPNCHWTGPWQHARARARAQKGTQGTEMPTQSPPAVSQGDWQQPRCAASPGVLISRTAYVTTASAPMTSALPVREEGGGRISRVLPPLRHTHASQSVTAAGWEQGAPPSLS